MHKERFEVFFNKSIHRRQPPYSSRGGEADLPLHLSSLLAWRAMFSFRQRKTSFLDMVIWRISLNRCQLVTIVLSTALLV